MQLPIGIVADDLTGANDTGVQFINAGYKTTVYLEAVTHYNYADVLAINTSSRHLSPEAAYQKLLEATFSLRNAGAMQIYKKIDSVMRGNVGAELDGVMSATQSAVAILTPAFPQLGRTVHHGILYVEGRPLEETELSRDILSPVEGSRISTIIARQSSRPVEEIHIEEVRRGPEALSLRLQQFAGGGSQPTLVLDAETAGDLNTISEAAERLSESYILSGSGGLAAAMAAIGPRPSAPKLLLPQPGGILLVCGTRNRMANRQVRILAERGLAHLLSLDITRTERDVELAADMVRMLDAGETVALVLGEQYIPESTPEAETLVQTRITTAVTDVLSRAKVRLLVLTGGDTARSITTSMGGWGLDLLCEVETGVPLGMLKSSFFKELFVITKSGSFGDEETFVRVLETMKEEVL